MPSIFERCVCLNRYSQFSPLTLLRRNLELKARTPHWLRTAPQPWLRTKNSVNVPTPSKVLYISSVLLLYLFSSNSRMGISPVFIHEDGQRRIHNCAHLSGPTPFHHNGDLVLFPAFNRGGVVEEAEEMIQARQCESTREV